MFRYLLLIVFLFATGLGSASGAQSKNKAARSDTDLPQLHSPAEMKAFIAEINDSLDMARTGGYGRLRRGDMDRMEVARNKIVKLLADRSTIDEMDQDDRLDLFSAHQVIMSALRKDEMDRMVCRRVASTGSRLAINECMTVADREARRAAARENVKDIQRLACSPGEGNLCAR